MKSYSPPREDALVALVPTHATAQGEPGAQSHAFIAVEKSFTRESESLTQRTGRS